MIAHWKGEIADVWEYDDLLNKYLINIQVGPTTGLTWVEADNPNLIIIEGE